MKPASSPSLPGPTDRPTLGPGRQGRHRPGGLPGRGVRLREEEGGREGREGGGEGGLGGLMSLHQEPRHGDQPAAHGIGSQPEALQGVGS